MNLLIIIVAVFAGLFVLVKLTEGRAKPLTPEQSVQLRRWIMIGIFTLMIVQGIALIL